MAILEKIKKAQLVGRGGGCFPTADKWEMVKKAEGKEKYVVCNVSEGEPGVKKDGYILGNYPEKVIDGMNLAIKFLGAKKGILYINHKYHKKFQKSLKKIIGNSKIEFFVKPIEGGYIGGEESAMLNAIEGKRIGPRLRPPFPTTNGLWNCPTLINNVETFYNVSLVNSGEYKKTRFYTINGDCLWTGVYEFPETYTIENILNKTNNYPEFDFFVQVGGDASGEVLNSTQLKRRAGGAASITIYSSIKNKPIDMFKYWLNFFVQESCGKCTPCREGVYRLLEIVNSPKPDWNKFSDILNTLDDTAFCGLGCVVPVPLKSYVNNVLSNMPQNKIKIKGINSKIICECFK